MSEILPDVAKILFALFMLVNVVPVMAIVERRVSAFIQGRVGPNRVGPMGFFQPLADALKFIFKEDIIPENANPFLYTLAPIMVFLPAAFFGAVRRLAGNHPHHHKQRRP